MKNRETANFDVSMLTLPLVVLEFRFPCGYSRVSRIWRYFISLLHNLACMVSDSRLGFLKRSAQESDNWFGSHFCSFCGSLNQMSNLESLINLTRIDGWKLGSARFPSTFFSLIMAESWGERTCLASCLLFMLWLGGYYLHAPFHVRIFIKLFRMYLFLSRYGFDGEWKNCDILITDFEPIAAKVLFQFIFITILLVEMMYICLLSVWAVSLYSLSQVIIYGLLLIL
jgi:hypothetical protein